MRSAALLLSLFSATALAQADPVEATLDDPALEARARALMVEIRCVVCEAQSIADSDAELAHAMRLFVRERLAAGAGEAAIRDELAALYGDRVLLRPRFGPATWALWFGPIVLLATGVAVVLGRRRGAKESAPLSVDERRRLATRLRELKK